MLLLRVDGGFTCVGAFTINEIFCCSYHFVLPLRGASKPGDRCCKVTQLFLDVMWKQLEFGGASTEISQNGPEQGTVCAQRFR